jgi:hypothetical protein
MPPPVLPVHPSVNPPPPCIEIANTNVANPQYVWNKSANLSDTHDWNYCAMSSSGQYQTASSGTVGYYGYKNIYISVDYGITFTASNFSSLESEYSYLGLGPIAMSSTGKYQIGVPISGPGDYYGFYYYSTDYGNTWDFLTNRLILEINDSSFSFYPSCDISATGQYQLIIIPISKPGVYEVFPYIFVSSDYGVSYVEVKLPRPTLYGGTTTSSCAMSASGQYMIACFTTPLGGESTSFVYSSKDYGISWDISALNTAPDQYKVGSYYSDISISSSGQYQTAIGAVTDIDTTNNIAISSDYGKNWTYLAPNVILGAISFLTSQRAICMSDSGQFQYIVNRPNGDNYDYIFISVDYGYTWNAIVATGKPRSWLDIAVSSNAQYLLGVTQNGNYNGGDVSYTATIPYPILYTNGNINFNNKQTNLNITNNLYVNPFTKGAIAIGYDAGKNNTGIDAITIGRGAGTDNTGNGAISIGPGAGMKNAGGNNIAIGNSAGKSSVGNDSIAIGTLAGNIYQQSESVAIGSNAGYSNQQSASVAIGSNAGYNNQQADAVAIGTLAGYTDQQSASVAIGSNAGYNNQQAEAVAIGLNAGNSSQGGDSVAIGTDAGNSSQGNGSIAIGGGAGCTDQGINSIAIGGSAGNTGQGINSIAIGSAAGANTLGRESIAIGYLAAINANAIDNIIAIGPYAAANVLTTGIVAIGDHAGFSSLGTNSIAIGNYACNDGNNSNNSIAIGNYAGWSNIGSNSIAIGAQASYNSSGNSNTIVISALGDFTPLNPVSANSCYIAPLRTSDPVSTTNTVMLYDSITYEVTYSGTNSGPNSIVIRDANGMFAINNIDFNTLSIAVSATTLFIVEHNEQNYILTGSAVSVQNVILINGIGIPIGRTYYFYNSSTANITLRNNSSGLLYTALPGSTVKVTLLTNSTAEGTWSIVGNLGIGLSYKDTSGVNPILSTTATNSIITLNGSSGVILQNNSVNILTISSTGVSATTFTGSLTGSASLVGVTDTTTNSTFYPTFVSGAGTGATLRADIATGPLTYNPFTGAMTATSFVGALTGNSDTSTRATNIAGGLGGSIPYQTAVNATSLLANGSVGQVLTSNGTTLAPSWGTPVGMVKLGTSSVAITGSASAQNLSFTGIFTTTYRNYKIILRPTTQISFTAYPSYALQAFSGTAVPTIASLYGFEITSSAPGVVTPIYTSGATISSAPLIFAVTSFANKEVQFDVLNVGYAVTQSQQVILMCKSVYSNPGISGASDRTINATALSGATITGLIIQQTNIGAGNNFTLEASIYGYT